jgi:uncharacterized Zn finger protein
MHRLCFELDCPSCGMSGGGTDGLELIADINGIIKTIKCHYCGTVTSFKLTHIEVSPRTWNPRE